MGREGSSPGGFSVRVGWAKNVSYGVFMLQCPTFLLYSFSISPLIVNIMLVMF